MKYISSNVKLVHHPDGLVSIITDQHEFPRCILKLSYIENDIHDEFQLDDYITHKQEFTLYSTSDGTYFEVDQKNLEVNIDGDSIKLINAYSQVFQFEQLSMLSNSAEVFTDSME